MTLLPDLKINRNEKRCLIAAIIGADSRFRFRSIHRVRETGAVIESRKNRRVPGSRATCAVTYIACGFHCAVSISADAGDRSVKIRNSYRNAYLRCVQTDESFAMITHDSTSIRAASLHIEDRLPPKP